jgi:hypothetical protein
VTQENHELQASLGCIKRSHFTTVCGGERGMEAEKKGERRENPLCPSTGEWIKKLQHIHRMENGSGTQRKNY